MKQYEAHLRTVKEQFAVEFDYAESLLKAKKKLINQFFRFWSSLNKSGDGHFRISFKSSFNLN